MNLSDYKNHYFTLAIILLVIVLLAFNFLAENIFYTQNPAIAHIETSRGEVSVREADSQVWSEALENQSLSMGSRVATEGDSQAKVAVQDKFTVELQSNTQVELDQEKSSTIQLVSGSIRILLALKEITVKDVYGKSFHVKNSDKKSCFSRVNDNFLKISCSNLSGPNDPTLALKKASRSEFPDGLGGQVKDKVSNKIEKEPEVASEKIKPSITNIEKKVQKKLTKKLSVGSKKPIKQKGVIQLGIRAPQASGSTMWAQKNVNGNSKIFDLTVTMKSKTNSSLQGLRPFVEILSSKGLSTQNYIFGKTGLGNQTIPLTMAAIKKSIKPTSIGSAQEWKVKLRSGVSTNSSSSKVYSPNQLNYKFRVISSFRGRSVTTSLRKFSQNGSFLTWKSENLAGRSGLGSQITVYSDQDLKAVMPSLVSGGFSINSSEPQPSANLFIVRKGSVVAVLKGAYQTQSLTRLRTALRGDFVYRGGANTVFSSQTGRSVASLKKWLQSSVRQTASLYIMRQGQLFPMARSFMKTDQQLKRFTGADAPYLFSSKVDIISYK